LSQQLPRRLILQVMPRGSRLVLRRVQQETTRDVQN